MPTALRRITRRSEYGGRSQESLGTDPSLLGYEVEWCWLIPRLHRALASPGSLTVFPKWTRDPRDHRFPRLAYWEAAHYLIHLLVGWREPAQGLVWLDRQGDSVSDPRLRLLQRVWNSSQQLELLLAWYAGDYRREGWFEKAPPSQTAPAPTFSMPESWWAMFRRRWKDVEDLWMLGPYAGGTNNLHLNHSLIGACQPDDDPGALRLHHDTETRRAVVILERMRGWHRQLETAGDRLPSLRGQSWYVDVLVQPVGWLGTFRQSRVTGLWFQGKHSVHMAGNAEAGDSA